MFVEYMTLYILAKSLCSPGLSPQSKGSHASCPVSDKQAFTHLSHAGQGSSWPQQGQGEKLGEAPACQPQTWVRAVPQRGLGQCGRGYSTHLSHGARGQDRVVTSVVPSVCSTRHGQVLASPPSRGRS